MGQLKQSPQNSLQSMKLSSRSSTFMISYGDLAKINTGKIANDYTILNPPIATNGISELRIALDKITFMKRIVKIYFRQFMRKEDEMRVQQEFEILRFIDHPNIVRVHQFYYDHKNLYMVTEFYSGCSLFEQIIEQKSFQERFAADLIKQILSAVTYIHQQKVIHRDIKPENIIFDKNENSLKIIDFGVSRYIKDNEQLKEKVGSVINRPYYIAPEVLHRNYNQKCDVWSCGIILYTMVVGSPPIQGRDEFEILKQIYNGDYQIEDDDFSKISNACISFIKKLLRRDPLQRPTAEQALQDDWIKNYCTKPNLNEIPNIRESLENMKKFHPDMKLQEAALFFIINNLTTTEEKQDLQRQFRAMDLNNDGKLNRDELVTAFKVLYDNIDALKEANLIMDAVDKNLSGAIDFSEYVFAAMDRKKIVEKDRLLRAFMVFDQDQSGSISADEFKRLFGNKISNRTVLAYINKVDENGDGQISFDEFYKMMNGIVTLQT